MSPFFKGRENRLFQQSTSNRVILGPFIKTKNKKRSEYYRPCTVRYSNACTVNIFKEKAQAAMPLHCAATRPNFLNDPSFSFSNPVTDWLDPWESNMTIFDDFLFSPVSSLALWCQLVRWLLYHKIYPTKSCEKRLPQHLLWPYGDSKWIDHVEFVRIAILHIQWGISAF